MPDIRSAYNRLDVPADADAREIRRAYARELKKIDQENDLADFQALREAYELALHRLEHPPQRQQQPSEPPAFNAQAAQEQVAIQAYERFRTETAKLPAHDDDAWIAALAESLASEQLLNLMAREYFEAIVAHHLASGWQLGNEMLLAAACRVFNWLHDERRLRQFSQAGMIVNRAIQEHSFLNSLPLEERAPLRATMARMRDPRAPTAEEVWNCHLQIKDLRDHYTTLMHVVVDGEAMRRWLHALENPPEPSGPSEPSEPDSSTPPKSKKLAKTLMFWLVAIVVGIPLLLAAFLAPRAPASAGRTTAAPQRTSVPDIRVPPARIKEISTRIAYHPKQRMNGTITVVYDIFLDADRNVIGMNKIESSGDVDFDVAVAKAIRESQAFPPNTETKFRANFSAVASKKPAAAKPAVSELSTGDRRAAIDQ
ncbi:TonB C-terminal domain-containing protein [Duganella sp. HH105]|uniref:TonB C-terminal domain-containing protein n=1 Tax=Duganella sp. HH105 TaxID=1781067 RepID=UPI000892C616|nr:TonB C-terminal domain-containing protein [Duganella sp. HH105]OEZ62201.1 hypothetical protein DUGA6_18870 [Duganella sp. HH105]